VPKRNIHPLTPVLIIRHPLSASVIYYDLCSICGLTVLFHNLSPGPLWSSSWPGTIYFILHTFLYPVLNSSSFLTTHGHTTLACCAVVPVLITLSALSHTHALGRGQPQPPKLALPLRRHNPNGISIGLTIFAGFALVTNRHRDR